MNDFTGLFDLINSATGNLSAEIFDALGFGVIMIDADSHKIVYANAKLFSMSGYTPEDILGKECHHLLCPAEREACPITNLGQKVDNSERSMLRCDGTSLPIIKTAVPLTIQGKKYLLESVMDNSMQKNMREMLSNTNDNLKVEIDKRTEVQEKLKHLAYHDYLTGLPNRLLFLEELRHAIFLADRSETILSVMFLDLDGFKMINDTMGHAVGDELLIEVAKRLKNTVRKSDGVARIGGDEFVVVFENIKEFDGIKIMTDKVLASFNQPFKINDQEIFVKTSLGVATYPINGNNAETLIQNADIAMYRAKEMGRNQGVIYTPLMENNINEYMRLSNQLYRALDRKELLLYYQPQVDCNTNEVIGMEALIRWNHPDLGLVLPARFIPIAERTGLIHSIGEWVIRTACNQNKAWQDAGLKKIPIAVNLSVLQFTDPFIVEKTAMILRECGLQPQYLEVEITESVIMKEMRSILDALNSFKRLGISISVDDFGTEYSSLQYLKELPVDKLKIAMPFVQGAEENDTDKAIINAILLLAEKTGMRVIAEGVETEEQLSFLVDSKCKEAQGFHFFRPLPADQMEKLLREGIGSQEG